MSRRPGGSRGSVSGEVMSAVQGVGGCEMK